VAICSDSHWKLSNCSAGDHREQQHRHRQQRADDQPPPQGGGRIVLGRLGLGRVSGGEDGAVAGVLDGVDELLDRDAGVELDGRRLGGVVDRGGDAVELVELALDAVGAGRARHPVIGSSMRSVGSVTVIGQAMS
jgi:hypothetical protein